MEQDEQDLKLIHRQLHVSGIEHGFSPKENIQASIQLAQAEQLQGIRKASAPGLAGSGGVEPLYTAKVPP